jgi:D-aminoacyl-tRNA deacylase
MRAVLQRVSRASVSIEGNEKAAIDNGLLVLLAAGQEDTEKDVAWMADKIIGLRVFEDQQGKMNLSVKDVRGEMIAVSQFTLYGDCRKGRRPSFVRAMEPKRAALLCEMFTKHVKQAGVPCCTGEFGAHMEVSLVNDGPVTLLVDSAVSRRSKKGGFDDQG